MVAYKLYLDKNEKRKDGGRVIPPKKENLSSKPGSRHSEILIITLGKYA